MKRIYISVLIPLGLAWVISAQAQCPGWNNFQLVTDTFTNPAFGVIISLEKDKTGKPFVYLAAKDAGVIVYDLSVPGSPQLRTIIPTSEFSGYDAINLFQDSIYLYVTLGDIWNMEEESGIAIIDISDPVSPVIMDHYTLPGSGGGTGCVVVRGDLAYLAAMPNGLIILNVAEKENIQFESQLIFTNDFPHNITGGAGMYNARGIDIKDSIAYICYDRGGLRIVNISNPKLPVEINQYCYAPLIDKATAYNNIAIHETLAFVALDYYGMEILDISNPMNITQLGWWHPDTWADTTIEYSVWANSKGHANELAYDPVCKILYMAAGKSDVVAVSVTDPAHPITCQTYGSVTDDYGTWGLDFFRDTVYAAYIWTFIFPPFSNYTGFAELAVDACGISEVEIDLPNRTPFVFPNPFSNEIYVDWDETFTFVQAELMNDLGQVLFSKKYGYTQGAIISFAGPAGIYWFRLTIRDQVFVVKMIKS